MSETRQKIKVQICLGTACFVLGAAELQTVAEEVPESWREIFEFSFSSCLDACKRRENGAAPPFALVDGTLYSDMSYEKLYHLLARLVKKNGYAA